MYGRDLDEEGAYRLGLAFGAYLKEGSVVVGRDGRKSSPSLAASLVEGLRDSGVDVLNVGTVPTPTLYYSVRRLRARGGVMVTASHNPPEWNGFKLVGGEARPVAMGFGLETVRGLVDNARPGEVPGSIRQVDILDEYIDHVTSLIDLSAGVGVGIDASNGVASLAAPRALRDVGCLVEVINGEVDGDFPGHPPEPLPEYLKDLSRLVVERGLHLGVAFDGDGDRAVFVDDRGRALTGDQALALLAHYYLQKNPGATVVFDASSSMAVKEVVESMGGRAVESRVGSAFIKQAMAEHRATLGGERSGHLYFSELGCMDDAIFATLRMAELASSVDSLSELVDSLPKYESVSLSVECPDEKKRQVVGAVANKLESIADSVSRIDGVKAYFGGAWVLVRASNTQPLVRITAEGRTKREATRLLRVALEALREAGCG